MGKVSLLLKVATVAGPAVVNMVRKYGPQLKQIVQDNPELLGKIKNRVSLASSSKLKGNSLNSVASRIAVLRDQVTYLYASANTPAVAKQASEWRSELDLLDGAVPVLGAMSKTAQRHEIKALQKRIDVLSSSILAAVIADDIEDAEMVTGEANNASEKRQGLGEETRY